jgi:TonB family protein
MQGLIQLSGHPLVHALGWTLLHFLWQGTAVALVLGCVLGLLGGQSSQARYGAACLALGLMVALPVATFAHVASDELKARETMLGAGMVLDAGIVLQVGVDEPVPPWPARIGAALDHAVPWVLLAWLAGVMVFAGRLNFGLLVARRLKSAGTEAPPAALQQLFNELRIRLGVERAVRLLHSAQVQVPTVIGWLRPVVLLPVSCLTGLSPEQIKAVLCHELAHVRRHDYLVSVVQSVIETVLFYHPAVWWVSKQVRRERECCCDQLAVGVGGNVLAYARALSYLEENRASFPEFVLGANGGVLKMRIKRLLRGKPDVEGSPVAALVALAMILAVAGSYFVAASRAQAQAAREIASAALPAGVVSVSQEGATAVANPASTLPTVYRNWLEQDVRWIITDPEAQAFKHLANDEERDKFIEQFWARRDPAGAAAGTFREEIYARIAYSNEHFASNDQVGWRTDRGHIYIAYGKPESIDSHPSGGSVTAYPYEVWHYPHVAGIGDNVDLNFVDTCKCGQYNYTIDQLGQPGAGAANQQPWPADRLRLAARIMAAPAVGGAPQSAATQTAAGAAQEAGAISGTIYDPTGALVPRAKVTATNTDNGVQTSSVTDNSGTYSISPLSPGPYNVEIEAKGFQRMLQENVNVKAGQTVGLNLKLTVGAAAQTLTVTGKPIAAAPPPPQWAPPWRPAPPKPTGPQRVSSGVMQGLAISQPQPVYPEEAKAQHIQGVVVLHARIAKDGTVKDLQVISGPPPLIVSAIDAVRQWKYKPYLLNGEPTEVDTTVNINYTFGGDAEPPVQPGSTPAAGTPQASSGNQNRSTIYSRFATTIAISASNPAYPPIAKAAHVQGDVILSAVISKTGEVEDVKAIGGPPMLVGSAIEAAKQWKFQPDPTRADPTPMTATLIVHFTLDDAAKPQGGNASMPLLIYRVDPEFSAEARQAKIGGVVLVNMTVNAQGIPENVHVLRGLGHGLDEQAVEAVKQYRFKPATEDGKPVAKELNIEVNFNIFDSPEAKAVAGTPNEPPVIEVSAQMPAAPAGPNIRSIDYRGLNSVTIQEVGSRFSQDGIELRLETPYDVARVARAAAVLKQLLAEHGHPNAIVTVSTQSIPPGAIAIQFNVKEGPKGTAATPNAAPASDPAVPAPSAPQQYSGVPVRKIGGGVTEPELIHKTDPEFSAEAKKAKFNGIVLVNLIVDAKGKPQNVHVLRGVGMGLDEKAIKAVKQYKFKPAMEGGKPVPVGLNVEINFQIF